MGPPRRQTNPGSRFCPLHGEYLPEGADTACPRCREDPIASTASLRRVRVVSLDEEDAEEPNEHHSLKEDITPLGDSGPCPVCGRVIALADFREEAIGEVWTGQAAVWAEEGVCADCHREVLPAYVRAWTPAEWMAHHFEGWRTNLNRVHDLRVYEENASEAWLPDDERVRILDVARTLEKRREHLARASQTVRELVQKYGADGLPVPFQTALEGAAAALSRETVDALKVQREHDLEDERARRQHSIEERAPLVEPPPVPPWSVGRMPASRAAPPAAVRQVWTPRKVAGVVAVLVVVTWLAWAACAGS